MEKVNIESLLKDNLVSRPGRYIGRELNASKKDLDKASVKVALCFPDVYEVGMSNLGLRILYWVLNSKNYIACERVFSPWPDLEAILRKDKIPIFSLESKAPLGEFDIIGFSLGYELCYTNVLTILDLAGIKLKSKDRTSGPLIIAGGPAASNPEPMSDFVDLFFIGEAEDSILKIIDTYRENRSLDRWDLLLKLAGIDGVYVPSLYDVSYNSDETIKSFNPLYKEAPSIIKKHFAKSLNKNNFPVNWIVPFLPLVNDRISLEIARGCPNKCRFCQGRAVYYPYRQRTKEDIVHLAVESYKSTGYEEIALFGLSVADHSHICNIVDELIRGFKDKAVSISLSSLKVKSDIDEVFGLIAKSKKTGLTFAPEAGSQRLRNIIGKNLNLEDLFKISETAYKEGYRHVKLYFMIGLPSEVQGDLDDIISLADNISRLKSKFSKSNAQVNLSISNFIPKPHTAFMWSPMENIDVLQKKHSYLRLKSNKMRNLKLAFHNEKMSFLEGVLSNGDRRLGDAILAAYLKGARFDAWNEFFNFDIWQDAFRSCQIEPSFYINRQKTPLEILPWDHIDIGINKGILREEFKKVCLDF